MKRICFLFLLVIMMLVCMASVPAFASYDQITNETASIFESPPAMLAIDQTRVQLNSPPASMGMNQLSDSIFTTTPTDATRCVTAANQLQNSEVKKNFAFMTLMKSGTKTQLASESQWAILPAVYLNVVTSESPPMISFDGFSLSTDYNNMPPPVRSSSDWMVNGIVRKLAPWAHQVPSLTSQVPIAPEQINTCRQSVAFNESYGINMGADSSKSGRASPVYTNNHKEDGPKISQVNEIST